MSSKKIITIVCLTACAPSAWSSSPGIEYQQIDRRYSGRHVRLHVFSIEQGRFNIGVHSFHQPQSTRVSPQQFRKKNNALLVLSGGFYYPDYQHPVGLVIQNKHLINPLSRHLSGVIWMKDGTVHLSEQNKFQLQDAKPDGALQGYPRLVDPTNKMGIYRPSQNIAHRAAVCTRENVFLMIINDKRFDKISLFELAEVLQAPIQQGGLSCDIAINLDGGPAPGISVSPAIKSLEIHPLWQLPNIIVVRPR